MSQVLANPERSDPPDNNHPPKVISLFAENSRYDRYREQIKCHTDLRFINDDNLTFLFITLKVQDMHHFSHFTFFAILFSEVPMWSTRFSNPKVTIPQEQQASESSDSRRVLNPKLTRVVTIGTLQYSMLMLILLCRRKRRRRNGYHLFQVLRGHYYCCHYLTWLWQRRLIFLYLSLPRSSSEKMYV